MPYEDSFKKLIVWKNAKELRILIYAITENFPKQEFKRVAQMRDAARSVKQNIQEGRKRGSELEFIRFLNIARASLAELNGDVDDCRDDFLISEEVFEQTHGLIRKTDFRFHRLIAAITKTVAKRK